MHITLCIQNRLCTGRHAAQAGQRLPGAQLVLTRCRAYVAKRSSLESFLKPWKATFTYLCRSIFRMFPRFLSMISPLIMYLWSNSKSRRSCWQGICFSHCKTWLHDSVG